MSSSFASFGSLWAQMSSKARLSLLGILALGIFLRVFLLDTFEFKGDELEAVMGGLAAPAQHWWIEHGASSSVHIPLGPAFSYIMGVLTAVSPDVYVITAFILAANIAVLLISVLFFAEFSRGRKQFLLCVFLFSMSPYAIIFSRKIWQPNLFLLFVIPLVLVILRVQRNPRLFLPMGVLSSIVVQLHHSGILYIPLLALFAVVSFRLASGGEAPNLETGSASPSDRRLLWAAAGFAAFVVLLVPYLTFFFRHFQHSGVTKWVRGTPHNFQVVVAFKWLVFTSTGSQFWRHMFSGGVSEWDWPVAPFPGAVLIFCYFLIVPFLLGVFKYAQRASAFIKRSSGNPAERPGPKDLLCASSIVFLFLIHCCVLDHGRPHHYTIILPFLILALSEGILFLAQALKPWRTAARLMLCVALVSYALQYPFVLLYVNANNGSSGEYGISYREQRNAAKRIAMLARQGKITMNPVLVQENSFSPERREDLQNTIAYICNTEFGTELSFNATPKPGARVLEVLKTGKKLHIEIGE
jgi:hypothetical protein